MSGDDRMWFYMDSTGQEFGPYPSSTMKGWFQQGFFPMQGNLQVRLHDMPEDQHYAIQDLYPAPINERAFDGEPNLPGDGRNRRGGRSGSRGGAAAAAPPVMDTLGASPYDGGLSAALWGGMPGMMPGAMQSPGMAPFGFPGMMPGMMPGRMPGAMSMLNTGVATGRFMGRIKSFNVQKGFGFIECPEAHQIYGRDVFLHKAQIGNFQIGSQVSFAVEMNKTNMPQARDLLESDMLAAINGGLLGMGGAGAGFLGGASAGKPFGGGKGANAKGKSAKAKPKGNAKGKAAPKAAGAGAAGGKKAPSGPTPATMLPATVPVPAPPADLPEDA